MRYKNLSPMAYCCFMLLALFCFSGCYDSPEILNQKFFREGLSRATDIVSNFHYDNAQSLSKEQLISLVGEPDFKVRPLDFEVLVDSNIAIMKTLTSREYIMSELWSDYLRYKPKKGPYATVRQKDEWRNSVEFANCMLWVYDESKHFRKPLPKELFCCLKPGFITYVFFIENSFCIGYSPFETYVPLLVKK